jgi:cation:H+ antiporter
VLLDIAALVAGLALLAVAGEAFVAGAGRLAIGLRISPVIVGALVIGFGTSAPEMLVSVLAAAEGALEIGVGNIIGSNIANVTLVAAAAAMVAPLAVSSKTLRREAPISAAAVLLFGLLVQGGLSRIEGLVLAAALVGAVALLVRSAVRDEDPLGDEALARVSPDEVGTGREGVRTGLGLLGVIVGAQLVVTGARGIADAAGIAEGFVGLTLVAVGTSLPEIVTAVSATRQGQTDLVVGNLFGSNMFNSLAVGGGVALVGPGPIDDTGLTVIAGVAMCFAALLAWYLMGTGHCLVRREAIVLVLVYAALLPLVL